MPVNRRMLRKYESSLVWSIRSTVYSTPSNSICTPPPTYKEWRTICEGPEQQQSFDELKKRVSSAETLGYFDKNAPTKMIADASPVGLGAVLVQEQGELRVISYASRSQSDTEHRYSQTEKEPLAIVWACARFHAYLYGAEFDLLTDHKPLECIFSPKSKTCGARIERWLLQIYSEIYSRS